MARSIREDFSHLRLKSLDGDYGMEIETEVASHDKYPTKFIEPDPDNSLKFILREESGMTDYWEAHYDGSLRNYGVEYVFKSPFSFDVAKDALKNFEERTKNIPFIQDAPGTSVHVHINVAKEDPVKLGNLFTLYTIFENVLVEYCGEARRSNLFALPSRVAERNALYMIQVLQKVQQKDLYAFTLNLEQCKYASLNLGRISKFGSVEARSFRGTTNIREIEDWLTILHNLWSYCRQDGLTPPRIMEHFKNNEETELFKNIFKDYSDALLDKIDGHLQEYIYYTLFNGGMISDCVDWSKMTNLFDQKGVKKKTSKVAEFTPPPFSTLYSDDYFDPPVMYWVHSNPDDMNEGEPVEGTPLYSQQTGEIIHTSFDQWLSEQHVQHHEPPSPWTLVAVEEYTPQPPPNTQTWFDAFQEAGNNGPNHGAGETNT